MRRLIPSFAITKVRWLHDPVKQPTRDDTRPKTRGTLILSLPTQDIQHQAIRKGIVIDSTLYEARLFENRLIPRQCFRCCQWGHTQSACKKQAKCGQCAGHHDTRDCTTASVSCTNCGRPHKSWRRQECKTYQVYRDSIDARRAVLFVQSATIRGTGATQPLLQGDGFQLVSSKRQRVQSVEKRSVGRPSFITAAARDSSQTRLTSTPMGTQASRSSLTDDLPATGIQIPSSQPPAVPTQDLLMDDATPNGSL